MHDGAYDDFKRMHDGAQNDVKECMMVHMMMLKNA
jgi:hypothetical protein